MITLFLWMITDSDNFPKSAGQERNTTINQQDEHWTGYSLVLHVLLTVVGLVLVWTQKDIFNKLLLQLDRSCVSVFCPSFSNREKLLRWASNRLPSTWSSQCRTLSGGILELWQDGSLLCTLINSAVPGACPNSHRHWKKPPIHAQILAYKYFGVASVFTEFDLSGDLTVNLEKDFIYYLQELQQAINKWQQDECNRKFSSQYVARGMGLYTGEQHRKTIFYIYSNITTKKRGNVLMYIRGPYGAKGKATISQFHDLKAITTANVLQETDKIMSRKNDKRKSFLRTISLDLTTFIGHENKQADKILIKITMEINRVKITYIPKYSGMYEINLVSDDKDVLTGCPYYVHVVKNNSRKMESFEENRDEMQITTYTKRKTLSRIIDCVDEQIFLYANNETNPFTECTLKIKQENNQTVQSKTNYHSLKKITESYFKEENLTRIEQNQNAILTANLYKLHLKSIESSKNLKNAVNSSNKILMKPLLTKKAQKEQRNNLPQKPSSNPLFITKTQNFFNSKNTSPICPNQIVPEVNYIRRLSVNEKRKLFCQNIDGILDESQENSSFSESENDEGSKLTTFGELSVLNHRDLIRLPQKSIFEDTEPGSISSTTSLPNITILNSSSNNFYQTKKKYWETVTSCNTSSGSLNCINSGYNKNLSAKPNYNNEDITKSAEDLSNSNYSLNCEKIKKYKSLDDSLENCAILSVEERKKMLLKNQHETENSIIKIRFKLSDKQKQDNRILETINKFDEITSKQAKSNENKTPKEVLKSQFKRAIKYFKNLEENSNKTKTRKISRRFSLNNQIRNKNQIEKGSSLKLSNISHSFPMNNLYHPVSGEMNDSFKVTSKQNISFSLRKQQNDTLNQDDIKFRTFLCTSKSRKRKTVKSFFDIY